MLPVPKPNLAAAFALAGSAMTLSACSLSGASSDLETAYVCTSDSESGGCSDDVCFYRSGSDAITVERPVSVANFSAMGGHYVDGGDLVGPRIDVFNHSPSPYRVMIELAADYSEGAGPQRVIYWTSPAFTQVLGTDGGSRWGTISRDDLGTPRVYQLGDDAYDSYKDDDSSDPFDIEASLETSAAECYSLDECGPSGAVLLDDFDGEDGWISYQPKSHEINFFARITTVHCEDASTCDGPEEIFQVVGRLERDPFGFPNTNDIGFNPVGLVLHGNYAEDSERFPYVCDFDGDEALAHCADADASDCLGASPDCNLVATNGGEALPAPICAPACDRLPPSGSLCGSRDDCRIQDGQDGIPNFCVNDCAAILESGAAQTAVPFGDLNPCRGLEPREANEGNYCPYSLLTLGDFEPDEQRILTDPANVSGLVSCAIADGAMTAVGFCPCSSGFCDFASNSCGPRFY